MSWWDRNILRRLQNDALGTDFEITLIFGGDVSTPLSLLGTIGMSVGCIRYCVRDITQHLWCAYIGGYLSADVDLYPVDYSAPPPEEERWVQFQSRRPARVNDFGGMVQMAGGGSARPPLPQGTGDLGSSDGYHPRARPRGTSVGPFYLCHPLFPMNPSDAGEFHGAVDTRPTIIELPTGEGLQFGFSVAEGFVNPFLSGADEPAPWESYRRGIS